MKPDDVRQLANSCSIRRSRTRTDTDASGSAGAVDGLDGRDTSQGLGILRITCEYRMLNYGTDKHAQSSAERAGGPSGLGAAWWSARPVDKECVRNQRPRGDREHKHTLIGV